MAATVASNQDSLGIQSDNRVSDVREPGDAVTITMTSTIPSGEEQALETHEVIELQSFSERKAWIEEKIKFLESLPPIEVFIGLGAIKSAAENVPGLPTRLELEQWMTEHDIIEKETEIFDKGELKKLRQLTKAATQRNLSPEDTDVIELTLTTIYTLDKLLHLLRDRSENLEMMSTRLSWEENRRTAWIEQRQIIEDLHAFAVSRARWNGTIYELSPSMEELDGHMRRGSIASQASASSDNLVSSPAFSRSARFRLAEMLSRDAAQFSGRVSGLRHGKVAAAGKALDRLIDQSRKPVPDELLDEQDRLEEKCITEMENVTKFALNLVMQWRKADEIYVETKKDCISSSNLLEEIEVAKLSHPTARQSASFMSRADTIIKRLAIRGNPSSPSNLFPRPEHFLFPDQKLANEVLIKTLSDDIVAADKLSRAVTCAAKEYKDSYEAVKRVEIFLQDVGHNIGNLSSIIKKFIEGIPSEDEDGSPPDLTSEVSLDPARHALFIAVFPSLLEDTEKSITKADQHLYIGPSLLLALDGPGIDTQFRENVSTSLNKLSSLRTQASGLRNSSMEQLAWLRNSRRIEQNITSKLKLLKAAKIQMVDQMERDRWHQQFNRVNAPLAPESPTTDLPAPQLTYVGFEEQLYQVSTAIEVDVTQPLQSLSVHVQSNLETFLVRRAAALQHALEDGRRLLKLLGGIREQSLAMTLIRDDFHGIMTHIEDAKIEITRIVEGIVELSPGDTDSTQLRIQETVDIDAEYLEPIQKQVTTFVDSLSQRVPFVSPYSPAGSGRPSSSLKSPPFQSRVSDETTAIPFDLPILDSIVRDDSNSYASRISGNYETLVQLKGHFNLSKVAVATDSAISETATDLNRLSQYLQEEEALLTEIPLHTTKTMQQLQQLLDPVGKIKSKHAEVIQSLPSIFRSLEIMEKMSQSLGSVIRDDVYEPRHITFNATENRANQIGRAISELQTTVQQTMSLERTYWEELEAAQLRQKKELEARIAAEEAARAQAELQRAEEEERQKVLAARREQEEARQQELLMLAEQKLVEQKAAAAEKRRLEDLEQRANATRLAEAEELRAQEEAQKAQLERERADALAKLRTIKAQLEQERLVHAERQIAAADLLHRQRNEMDELAKRQLEIELLAEENAHQAQIERSGKQRMEKETKESEEHLKQQYLELQQLVEIQTRLTDMERAEKERAESEAKMHADVLTEQHMKDVLLAEDITRRLELAHAETQRAELEARKLTHELEEQRRVQITSYQNADQLDQPSESDQDVFGMLKPAEASTLSNYEDLTYLQNQVLTLRKRLRSLCMDGAIAPPKGSTQLPTNDQFQKIQDGLEAVSIAAQTLPISTGNTNFNVELKAFRDEIVEARLSLTKIQDLVDMSTAIQHCDTALSDLLEHVDSYPLAPLLTLSTHKSIPTTSSEEQMTARLAFTESLINDMYSIFENVVNDHRAMSEHLRINQTWAELREMAVDLVHGRKSRSASVLSRGSSTGASTTFPPKSQTRFAKKSGSYSNLSVTSVSGHSKGKMLAPPVPVKPRRAVSNTSEATTRSAGRVSSTSTTRSVSGPINKGPVKPTENMSRSSSRLSTTSTTRSVSGPLSNSLYGTTFASRQRTTSLSAAASTPPQRPSVVSSRFRMNSETKRGVSPAISETSSYSHSHSHSSRGPRPSLSGSTWSRAPRDSVASLLPRVTTPHKKFASARQKYVADPKNKLDVAVGDVINKLEVGINIESISDSWRDQSGKYWIGDQDPKLCFCRILRSQTVMVRVGGGWSELSKFIKDHFADSFRIVPGPESPPRPGSQNERWISSATLLEARESISPPRAPLTPEPNPTFLPSFSLVTPSGHSPKSFKSLSPPSLRGSSPLTPLQFMRRAEPGPDMTLLQPAATPSKSSLRGRISNANTPSHNSVWRP